MTVSVTKKDRERIEHIKSQGITDKDRQHIEHIQNGGGYMSARVAKGFKEIVLDESYKDINKRGYIYESPDGGKTIYRRAASYCDVSGVKIDEPDQLELNFNKLEEQLTENDVNEQIATMQDKLFKMATLIDDLAEGVKKLRDNN